MPNDTMVFELELHVDGVDGEKCCYIHSKDVPGLHLIGKNFKAMKPIVEKAIKRLFLDNRNTEVNVIWVSDIGHFQKHDVELPTKVAIFPVKKAA